jgi:hypothetical protein
VTVRFLRALVEDKAHEGFIRGLLDHHGLDGRQVRFQLPVAGGSGEQFVREQMPRLLRELRTQRHQSNLWAVVVTDGDQLGWHRRRESLIKACLDQGLEAPSADDRLMVLIPSRNIETWGWWLLGNFVDEESDYKPVLAGQSLRHIARDRWHPPREAELEQVPSLARARNEWSRLP